MRGWAIWALASAFYGYAFFQRVAPGVMVDDLMRDFAVGAAVLGQFSAAYFYAYAGLQIPIGLALDRFGGRAVLVASALTAAGGSALLAMAPDIGQALAGRLLVGAGTAATWIGALWLAMVHLPPRHLTLGIGLTMFVGMAGAVGGQAPLAAMVADLGWRWTMMAAAIAALALAIGLFLVADGKRPGLGPAARPSALAGLLRLMAGWPCWALSGFAGSLAGPLLAFSGLWGVPYLMQTQGLSRPEAAGLISLTMIGWGLGSPAMSLAEKLLGDRRRVMMATGGLAGILWFALFRLDAPSPWTLGAVFLIQGLCGGGMVVTFALARDYGRPETAGVFSGVVNTFVMGSGAVLQAVVGLLLDRHWSGAMAGGARVYAPLDYHASFAFFPLLSAAGLLLLLTLRRPIQPI